MQNGSSMDGHSGVEVLSWCYINPCHDVTITPVDPVGDEKHVIAPADEKFDTCPSEPVAVNGNLGANLSVTERTHPVFISDYGITLRITDLVWTKMRLMTSATYEIKVHHAGYHWKILRNYQQIHALHINLYFFDTAQRLSYQIRGQTRELNDLRVTPALPKRLLPDASKDEEIQHHIQLESYFWDLFRNTSHRELPVVYRFLGVTGRSFSAGAVTNQEKDSEALIQKLSCHFNDICFSTCDHNNIICKVMSHWHERWVTIQETCYIYTHPSTGLVAGVFLLDQDMEVERLSTRDCCLLIKHCLKDLTIRFPNKLELCLFESQLKKAMLISAADFTTPHPHGSFCPVRDNIPAKLFIDGEAYMDAVADALENAKDEIFMGAWWMSPDIFLKRPVKDGLKWRLDHILKRKADEGVGIYILMYKESRLALGINSFYTKKKLKKLHADIHVQRHPDRNILLWSHHEKTVIVDQKVAFVGGIDLCYGRWDNHLYRLSDLTQEMLEEGQGDAGAAVGKYGQPSQDLNDRHVSKPKPTPAVRKRTKKSDTVKTAALAPWRGMRARMPVPKYRPRTRFQFRMRKCRRTLFGRLKASFAKIFGQDTPKEPNDTEDGKENMLEKLRDLAAESLWLGKDYCNEVKYAFSQPDNGDPLEDLLDRKDTPRLPWHDAGACVWGTAARDTARHFIQKWNACKFQKFRFEDDHPFLIPKLYRDCTVPDFLPDDTPRCRVQAIRSTCSWSAGLLPDVVEQSIQQAYIDLIHRSKHFIYMESQFFITLVGSKKTVKNRVGDALFHRIVRAANEGANFRLYIVLPLQPAIAGAYGTRAGAAVQAVTHWIYQSISRGKYSLLGNLRKTGIDPSNYVTVCGMRQHGEILGRLATELVYVHSKLMVVDDVFTIIGSANMNDRSMTGDRDSEIAWLIEDIEFEDSHMDDRPYRSGLFSGRLRKNLMKINLGLMSDMPHGTGAAEGDTLVQDPVCEQFYRHTWIKTAVQNEEIFQEVFACIPNDKVFTFSQLKEFEKQKSLNETDPDRARQLLEDVRGYLVKFPLEFLKDSKLLPAYSTAAGLLPAINWT